MNQINRSAPLKENLLEDHYQSAGPVNILKSFYPPIR